MPIPAVVQTSDSLRASLESARSRGLRVALVPTMGGLHPGHLRLVEEAKRRSSYVALSIFVNPTQFGPNEDLARYPRDLENDLQKCGNAGVDLVFAPEVSEMYPPGDVTRVRVGSLGEPLCGAFRPGHFEGVATVVAKLFALFSPCLALFGKKDYQQLRIVTRMAKDLLFDVEVLGVATVRDADGVASSTRNGYLSLPARQRARSIPQALDKARTAFLSGERSVGALRKVVLDEVAPASSRVDYVSIADPETLAPIDDGVVLVGRALVALAVWFENTRLIDNLMLGEDLSPMESVR